MKQADDSLKNILSNEPLLAHNKHAKDIYNSQPWTGQESNYDANLRMVLDTTPKQKPIGTPLNAGLKRKPTSHEKLAMARDVSLDYKINKPQSKSDKEEDDDGFREMYKERLLESRGNKINATINQTTGTFDGAEMRKVRGKPLDRDHLRNCTDLNYFMNQILKKQEVKPVWIENQLSLDGNIRAFKQGVEDMWFRWMIYDSEIAHVVQSATVLGTIEHEFERKVTSLAAKDKDELAALLNESDLKYVETKVGLLNLEIRNYNLQCPSVTGHKFKLQADRRSERDTGGCWRISQAQSRCGLTRIKQKEVDESDYGV
ncbi:hypothetical protein Cantr_06726 [Candida viswanathii]|uniref:DnaJ homologue subfamily C member 28 conserved domain-containing protein n=1 Tax=Candida viswanathii TaxID=5486 RepID=A0A367XWU8_9ASCO|nr:hypothetical protein Cantr_06726 [Candida viswanathii]